MFGRFKGSKSTVVSVEDAPDAPKISSSSIDIGGGIMVDPSCNTTITVNCLLQLYNATGYQAKGKGSIGITGYLEENVSLYPSLLSKKLPTLGLQANIQDLQTFFAEQRPDAVGTNFTFISVAGWFNK